MSILLAFGFVVAFAGAIWCIDATFANWQAGRGQIGCAALALAGFGFSVAAVFMVALLQELK